MVRSYRAEYANSWALLIGINTYRRVPPLQNAREDAIAMAQVLQERFAFPADHVTLLLDEHATQDAIRQHYLSFADPGRTEQDDRVIVFFAGHGHTVAGHRGEVGFLVPVDGAVEDISTLIRWDDLTRNADLIPAKHVLFLMDACYGGLALTRGPAFGAMRFMGDMLQRYVRQVLTAGKADETVADGAGVRPGHSIFTAHLLNALEGEAATEDGILTANGVMAYVFDRVARDQYSHQTPHYGFVDGDGDLIFDTTVLNRLRAAAPTESAGGDAQTVDILVNPAPVIVTDTQIPLSVAGQLKELLTEPTKRIKLDDFVTQHIRTFLDATDLRHFPVHGQTVTKEEIAERVALYESEARDLQEMVIVLATWAEESQLLLLERIFSRLAEADKGKAGLVAWLKLGWYPFVYLLYSAGIAALAAKRFNVLSSVFRTTVTAETTYGEKSRPLAAMAGYRAAELHDYFKLLPGHERHFVPRSEYMFKALQPVLEDLLMLGRRYEDIFDQFELLLALEFMDQVGSDWAPPGRFAWKHRELDDSPITRVMQEAEREGESWPVLRAGLFQGSAERFANDVASLQKLISKLPWL